MQRLIIMSRLIIFGIIAGWTLISCRPTVHIGPIVEKDKEFDQYWNQGKAEITSYDLYQARYGEMRHGEAVILFVTENFSKEKQVKTDRPNSSSGPIVPVLKMNMVKRFHTGIYPYSMMLSSFVAAGGMAPWQAIKITSTVTEWCGQVYTQLNLHADHYQYQMHSYFESEGEVDQHLNRHMTEDAVWNLIRINPSALIQSDSIMIIPGLFYSRLNHRELKPYRAKTYHLNLDIGNKVYHIEYPDLGRSLYIEYEPQFPYAIVKWSEDYKDGVGDQARVLTTTAQRRKQIMTDYWTKNRTLDDSLRLELDLLKL